ncbi:unnamed protein product [Spirodela intermedia]|uniref:Uncharacterized protein n=1 Tax=Spirodela intermedia TaxID=51605 RepID=A0A7I8IJG7_SPIIN|nr:unnamed protein product [Spirodela intermedia]CAA6657499.1 unnamed protein product [Spirodela intermedia]
MEGSSRAPTIISFFPLLLLLCWIEPCVGASATKTYIVRFARSEMPAEFVEHRHWYDASLQAAEALGNRPGVVAVIPETRYQLHTTRTPEFLGLSSDAGLQPQSDSGTDVVVGVLDTGVWPEIRSYDDSGFGPVPETWKGGCDDSKNFKAAVACNKKLIGARFFSKGYEASMGPIDESKESKSPRDDDGHGTHTSTTAAGSFVRTPASSDLPPARLEAWPPAPGLPSTRSVGPAGRRQRPLPVARGGQADYYRDGVAVGAFAAMEKGILVSCSAGNAGPGDATLSNVAPWITTVGAGTIDRDFPAFIALGNGKNYSGVSLYSGNLLPNEALPLIYAGNATNATNGNLCLSGTLIPEKVAGKIVLCDRGVSPRVQKGFVVKAAGGLGMVLSNTAINGEELVADAHILPAAAVGEKMGNAIRSYALSDPAPTATIVFAGTKVGVQPSPVVAAFSSRGPNAITPGILKPDLIAPGVNILAGWSGGVGPTGLASDSRRTEFNIISGTSMSPAAIKSALMTTAYDTYKGGDQLLDISTGKPATPFDVGAGHVDPVRALDPGLVYDLSVEDYLGFLCALGYTPLQVAAMSNRNFSCDSGKKHTISDFNYPSFSVPFQTAIFGGGASGVTTVKHTRTLTNVGTPGIYKATVSTSTNDVKVLVEPSELSFEQQGEKKTYTVTFSAPSQPSGSSSFGRLVWSDGRHTVSSPVAFTWT